MAENDSGIHPEVMRHIVDLHRKHSELQMQMHDKDSGDDQEMLGNLHTAVTELTTVIRELITVVKEDVKADKAVANGERGKRKRAGEGSGAQPNEGEA